MTLVDKVKDDRDVVAIVGKVEVRDFVNDRDTMELVDREEDN